MKLATYMKLKRLTDAQFAVLIGKTRTAVLRYRRGDVMPSLRIAAEIEAVTEGAVTFRDFVKTERPEA